jgi:hypothetical protein
LLVEPTNQHAVRGQVETDFLMHLSDDRLEGILTRIPAPPWEGHMARPRIARRNGPFDEQYLEVECSRTNEEGHGRSRDMLVRGEQAWATLLQFAMKCTDARIGQGFE